ncbi:hypothetical protein GMA19_03056 [Paenibacillus polymyxa E681]|uniref:hypothetical protein n=1 Tax=Paenibacillus polymyxa TaxID=1406 RepID=UPI0001E31CBD|nr:hypothetical protein [Paenibacillus polymyxa]ADM70863.1 hypothetical protein PPE_03040 [Paenibacillus polymyxa E681]QNV57885.1 hypothetical protein GE561_03056 [Paenibacillus polymyxa E681]QNV62722.1 hypothetical protein GMA19_03056 [Paenibacillus polymyxa E681]
MSQSLTVDFLLKTKKVEQKFVKDLSIYKIMIDLKTLLLLIASSLTVVVALIIPFYALYTNVTGNWPVWSCLASSLLGLLLLQISVWFSHSLARKKYPKYNSFISNQKININYDYDFIFAYRCDEMLELFNTPIFQNIEIDDLIDFFSKKSVNIKIKRWDPVTLTGLILFPLWSEFIGNNIGQGWDMKLFLLLLSLVVAYLLIMLHSFLRTTLLSKSIKYDELVNILSTVKNLS